MSDAAATGYVPIAQVVRSGFVEGIHFGVVVGLKADGSLAFAFGDVDRPMHPRSTSKLMQATGMRGLGLSLTNELLALSAASHWGEPMHVDAVKRILHSVGLPTSALQNTAGLPEDPTARRAAIVADQRPASVFHGCSGKHASMLATCVVNDWDIRGYLSPTSPLQVALRASLETIVGEESTHTAVDGCGSPAWAISLRSLAGAYRAAVLAEPGSDLAAVAVAMRAHPEYVGGTASEVTGLMRAAPGLLVKDGAEAVYVAALPDGRTVAVKVADGGFRAGQVVLASALERLGIDDLPGVDKPALAAWSTVPVLGHGEPVGAVRPVLGCTP